MLITVISVVIVVIVVILVVILVVVVVVVVVVKNRKIEYLYDSFIRLLIYINVVIILM